MSEILSLTLLQPRVDITEVFAVEKRETNKIRKTIVACQVKMKVV